MNKFEIYIKVSRKSKTVKIKIPKRFFNYRKD
ncbi:unnamed protein product, partial [marine sediment metagenome]